MGLAHQQPLIRSKEKQLVLYDRPAQYPAEIVLPQFRPCKAVGIGEPIVGVQFVVAEVFERGAVKGVRAGSGYHRNLRAWSAPIFRCKGRSLNPKLFERI